MSTKKEDKLWRPFDDKNKLLWTQVPNCLIEVICMGGYKSTEIKILLYISRMSFGFHREDTNFLSLEDFEGQLVMKKAHVSKAIKSMVNDDIIFKHSKNGNKYKYVINLLRHGLRMKHYRAGKLDDKIDDGVYKNGSIDNELSNYRDSKDDLTLYSKKGYDNSKESYIKEDINTDIKIDRAVNVDKVASSTRPSLQRPPRISSEQEKAIYDEFIKELKQNYHVDTLLKYMKKLKDGGVACTDITEPYVKYCKSVGIDCSSSSEYLYPEALKLFKKLYEEVPFK